MHKIVLTAGEPAGIGPDLLLQAIEHLPQSSAITAIGNASVLMERATLLGLNIDCVEVDEPITEALPTGQLAVKSFPVHETVIPGKLNTRNARHVLDTLAYACDCCINQSADALVTGPVHKGIINDSGIAFTGHTEFFAERSGGHHPVMLLTADKLRVALATTHLPLQAVSAAITKDRLTRVISILHQDLQRFFGLNNPRILVCGLNPHAGEDGHLGREEIDIINPCLDQLREQGINVSEAMPADTLFTPRHLDKADAVLAMFHDQGLPVLKYAGFGRAVNITLGLPIIRTSVDHGTALSLAGSGQAEYGSLLAAINTAEKMIHHSQ